MDFRDLALPPGDFGPMGLFINRINGLFIKIQHCGLC